MQCRPALLLLMMLTLLVPAQGEELRVAASGAWSMPFGQVREGQLVDGINHDIAVAIAEKLGRTVRYVVLPRPRLDAAGQAGEYDLRCHVDPEWTRQREAYAWSPPLFDLSDVLIGHTNAKPVASLDELPAGEVIGSVTGYVYPALEARFADGRLRRDDTIAVDRSLRKLTLARSGYAVVNARDLSWYMRQTPQHAIATWRLPISRWSYHCAVPVNAQVPAAEVFAALQQLRASGRIERILAAHHVLQAVAVVAQNSPIQTLDRERLTALFLGEQREAGNGGTVQLLTLGGALRDDFYTHSLKRETAQVRMAWTRLVFAGRARAPQELPDARTMRARLLANPMALGFMDLADVDDKLRVVFAP